MAVFSVDKLPVSAEAVQKHRNDVSAQILGAQIAL
jgi:hypothetical protein